MGLPTPAAATTFRADGTHLLEGLLGPEGPPGTDPWEWVGGETGDILEAMEYFGKR